MKKNIERVFELDFIRAIAIICIVIFHFYVNNRQVYNSELVFLNYDLGQFGVSLFLILSGASLYVSEKNKFDIFDFYKKRIKSIFPLFIVGTFSFFVILFLYNPHIFDNVSPINWIPTILGFGGLLSYKYPSYNVVGEWYIGCILVLYLVYPLLRLLINKIPKITFFIVLLGYILLNVYYPFKMMPIWCPWIRIMEFVYGIYFAKYIINSNILKGRITVIITFVINLLLFFLFVCIIKNNLYVMIKIFIGGILSFNFLFCFAHFINLKKIKSIIMIISKYSYSIFICHHQIGNLLQIRFSNEILSSINYYYVFVIYLLLVFISAYVLSRVTKMIQEKLILYGISIKK